MGILFVVLAPLIIVAIVAHCLGKWWPALGNFIHGYKSLLAILVFCFACWNTMHTTGKGGGLGMFTIALGIAFLSPEKRFGKDGKSYKLKAGKDAR